ncbi:TetR/AcrR family transcriptional regulator C-terminal domain-containing protein [Frankia sp. AgB1.9]|uniref:TetR/AcrR family transcriptional regulator n=1 Tax=unclassified Frankia TaxID=2632575 RepID=UPI001931E4F1|nr:MULTISPECIES: TetR/AcrR family transcriptional regulator [unclassified Frankia]MBL7489478.1 TetR/AcrR family transcriptional regulator C-terminal domain-containing protein [Frankia sp. AgW1.1]MBL7548079.1 TetR/AcrR family transcriptional regulator C-terminal domain-containing protein [Frankia sp. AgB1.9]MBL7618353.1 TetR/AcrR family transcriptional regulator C-terminal domain-containing protein [Frankia sp. AgB1.8]
MEQRPAAAGDDGDVAGRGVLDSEEDLSGPPATAHGCASTPPEAGSARWWFVRAVAARKRRPRQGGLSVARIIDATLDVLQKDGFEALTLRSVAERLDSTIGSLYRHIGSRDELIALLTDHVMGDIRTDRTGQGWRADIEALMREVRRLSLSVPLPPAARTQAGYGPNMLRVIDAALALFLEAGLTAERSALATINMMEFLASSAIRRNRHGQVPAGALGSDGFSDLLTTLPADRFAALRTAGTFYVSTSAEEVFDNGLAIFLDGVTSHLPEKP